VCRDRDRSLLTFALTSHIPHRILVCQKARHPAPRRQMRAILRIPSAFWLLTTVLALKLHHGPPNNFARKAKVADLSSKVLACLHSLIPSSLAPSIPPSFVPPRPPPVRTLPIRLAHTPAHGIFASNRNSARRCRPRSAHLATLPL